MPFIEDHVKIRSERENVWPIIGAVTSIAAIFGLAYGLVAPLVAHDLHAQGYSNRIIGSNSAIQAAGVLTVAGWLPRLAIAYGTKRLMFWSLAVAACVLVVFALMSSIWMWFALRFGLGVAAETLFVCSETWINQISHDGNRGRVMGMYTAAQALGFAGGPLILSVVGFGAIAYLTGAGCAVLAMWPLLYKKMRAPDMLLRTRMQPMASLRLAPVALSTAFLNAAIETAGLSFFALYAMNMHWSETAGLHLITTLLIGAILMQVPIGWIADRMDRRKLIVLLALLSMLGALFWPLVFAIPWLTFPLIFLWGGTFVGIYAVTLAIIGSRFTGGDLLAIYAVLSIAWGLGALFGPMLIGIAMQASPRYGLPISTAIGCGMFAVLAACRRRPY